MIDADNDDKNPYEPPEIEDAEVVSEVSGAEAVDGSGTEPVESNGDGEINPTFGDASLSEDPSLDPASQPDEGEFNPGMASSDQTLPNAKPVFPYSLINEPAEDPGDAFVDLELVKLLQQGWLTFVVAPTFAYKFCQSAIRTVLGGQQYTRADTELQTAFPGPLEQTLKDESMPIAGNILLVALESRNFKASSEMRVQLQKVAELARKRNTRVLISVNGRSQFAADFSDIPDAMIELAKVDWLKAWFARLETDDSVDDAKKQATYNNTRKVIAENAALEWSVWAAVQTFDKRRDPAPIDAATFEGFANSLQNAEDEEALEEAFIAEVEAGWDSKLAKLLMTLASLGTSGNEGLRIESVLSLGSQILAAEGATLMKPNVRQIESQTGNSEIYERSLMEPVEVSALKVWEERLDILIRRCKLEVVRERSKTSDDDEGEVSRILKFKDEKTPELFLRLYPGLLTRLGERICRAYPRCSESRHDQGSMVRSVSIMLAKLSDLQPTQFNFELFWQVTVDSLVQQELEEASDNAFDLMHRAFPATQILYKFWHFEKDKSKEKGEQLLLLARKSVAHRVQKLAKYDPYRGGLFALLYLAVEEDYPIAKTTSEFLGILIGDKAKISVVQEATERLTSDKDTPQTVPENIINITRQVLKFVMREGVEVRERILLDHFRHRQKQKQTSYYLELLYARVVYDAMFRDFSEPGDGEEDKLGAKIYEGLDDGSSEELVKAIWSAKINLFDLTARHGDRTWFHQHVAIILGKSYDAYAADMPDAPSNADVRHLLVKALKASLQGALDRSDEEVEKAGKDERKEAISIILETIDGRPRDEVARIWFSQASLVRAVAASRWPFLSLGERIEPGEIRDTKKALLAFPARLSQHLGRLDRVELDWHWRMQRDVLIECKKLAREHLTTRAEMDCVVGWLEEREIEIGLLIQGFSELGRSTKALDQKDV